MSTNNENGSKGTHTQMLRSKVSNKKTARACGRPSTNGVDTGTGCEAASMSPLGKVF